MRYLKLDADDILSYDKVCEVIINMMYNRHLYDDSGYIGSKKEYNTYSYDGVKYSVNICSLCVYYITNRNVSEFELRNTMIKKIMDIRSLGVPLHLLTNEVMYPGILIKRNYPVNFTINFNNSKATFDHTIDFYIVKKNTHKDSRMLFYNDEYPNCGYNMLSVLLVDEIGIFPYSSKKIFRGPKLKDYLCVRVGNVLERKTRVKYGLFPEIYDTLLGKKHKCCNYDIWMTFWLHWSEVFPKKRNMNVGWLDQLKLGNLYEQKNTNHANCFITGVPIFEDCYVIDIYEERQTLNVSEKLQGDVVVKTVKRKSGIVYTVVRNRKYDSPYQILLSEAAFLVEPKLLEMLKASNFKFIIYRTFSPTLAHTIINSLEENDVYKDALHMFNNGYINNTRMYNDKKYMIVPSLYLPDLITLDQYTYVINVP